MRKRSIISTAIIGSFALSAAVVAPAAADSITPEPVATRQFTESEIRQAFDEFVSSDVPREEVRSEGESVVTFHLTEQFSLTMVRPEGPDNTPGTRLGAGHYAKGYWFSFNQFDQNALSNILVGAAITAAICAIPAVGQVACALAGVAVGIAITYIHKNGICSGNRLLYWYDVTGGSTIACRSSAPK